MCPTLILMLVCLSDHGDTVPMETVQEIKDRNAPSGIQNDPCAIPRSNLPGVSCKVTNATIVQMEHALSLAWTVQDAIHVKAYQNWNFPHPNFTSGSPSTMSSVRRLTVTRRSSRSRI